MHGDIVTVKMELSVRLIEANPYVRSDVGKVAVMREPGEMMVWIRI